MQVAHLEERRSLTRRPSRTCTHAARRPAPAGHSSTSTVAHSGSATGQRGWNGQPAGMSRGSGGSPPRPDGRQPEARVADHRERRRERRRVRVRGVARTRPRSAPPRRSGRRTSPRVRWQHVRERREVVRDEDHREAELALQLARAARAPAPAPSRRAPSSARRRSAGAGCRRARARSARAAAGRRRAGADSRPRGAPAGRPSRAARPRAPLRVRAPCGARSIASAICSPIRCTGLSACSAPWNTIDISVQRTARSRPGFIVSTSSPSSSTSPVDLGPARQQPQQRARDRRLPAARLAREPERLAGREIERDAAHGGHGARLGPVGDVEIADARATRHRLTRRSLAEPRVEDLLERLADEREREHDGHDPEPRRQVVPPGVRARAHRPRTPPRASSPTRPRVGSPSPRNASVVSERIAIGTVSVELARMSGDTFGRMCRLMTCAVRARRARGCARRTGAP